jgi:hypothetical protein
MPIRAKLLVLASLAGFAVAAAASPVVYNVTDTMTNYSSTWNIAGNLSFCDGSLCGWTFDFSQLAGQPGGVQGYPNFAPIDANGSYVLSNLNTVLNPSSNSTHFYFDAYAGDGTSVAMNSNLQSVAFDLIFSSFPGALIQDGSGAYGQFGEEITNSGCTCTAAFGTGGYAVLATPEPPSGLLLASGLALAGIAFLWFERRRVASTLA